MDSTTPQPDLRLPLKPNEEKPKLQTALLGLLSYLHMLFLVPLFLSAPGSFEKFHALNGGALFAATAIGMFLGSLLPVAAGSVLFSVAVLLQLIFAIIGTRNILLGQREGLPVLGKLVERFTAPS